MSARKNKMSGARKSALLLLSMPEEAAAQVLAMLPEDQVTELATEIAALGPIPHDAAAQVVEEFAGTWEARLGRVSGGLPKVKKLLERADPAKAASIVNNIDRRVIDPPFSWMHKVDNQIIVRTLSQELPITCAVVLAFLNPDKAASIMLELPAGLRSSTAIALATLDDPDHDIVEAVEIGIRERLGPNAFERQYRVGGVDSLVSLLNRSDRETESEVLGELGKVDEHLAVEVKRRLFLFEDIAALDPKAIQKILAGIDMSRLPLAMKGVSEETKNVFMENMSERAAELLLEEIEILGPVRLADVQAAQAEVIAVVNRLDADGEIMINRGADALVN